MKTNHTNFLNQIFTKKVSLQIGFIILFCFVYNIASCWHLQLVHRYCVVQMLILEAPGSRSTSAWCMCFSRYITCVHVWYSWWVDLLILNCCDQNVHLVCSLHLLGFHLDGASSVCLCHGYFCENIMPAHLV